MGRLDEALDAARKGLPLFRSCEHLWLLAEHFALRAALQGNLATAARLAGYGDATLTAKGATRQTNEARARARLQQVLDGGLSPQALEGLLSEGARMRDDEAMKLAMGE